MRLLGLIVVIGGLIASVSTSAAQVSASNDPLVIAAYAKTTTPSGVKYRNKEFDRSSKQWFDGDLEVANIVSESAPLKESSYSWRGRREGFLGNHAKAIEIFTEGMELFADSYALYRYRGYHLVRNYQFEAGIIDLRRAEELIEHVDVAPAQAGIPGKSNFSPSTFKRNIYYYLAQSSMATGDYNTVIDYMDKAVASNELPDEDDFLLSTSFYKYMAMRKLGRHDEAKEMIMAIPRGLNIISNKEYYDAIQFLQGRYSRERFIRRAGNLGKYAIGMIDHFNGDDEAAEAIWVAVTESNHKGYWLAEIELMAING